MSVRGSIAARGLGCRFERWFAAGMLALALSSGFLTEAQAAATLTGVVARKVHGAAGTFNLPLSNVASNPTTEPRLGPTHTIVFTFNVNVTSGVAAVSEGVATVGTPTFNGMEMVVPLTAVGDAQYVTVKVSNVASAAGPGSGSIRIGFLAGDVNQNRVVTVADVGLVNAQLGQPVAAIRTGYLYDVNADGAITLSDKAIVNADLGHALPAPTVAMTGAVSRKVHAAAGTFNLSLSMTAWNPTTEPRQGPNATIVFSFDGVVTSGTASVSEGVATVGTPTFNGTNEMTVPLTGVADGQYVTVNVSNIVASNGTGGSGSIRIGFLVGDVNQSRLVTTTDMSLIGAQQGIALNATNFFEDINLSGTITPSDLLLTSFNLNHALPAPILTFTAAKSRKLHGAAGPFDLVLGNIPTNPTTEPRTGPTATIVFTFNSPVSAGSAAVTEGVAVVGTPTFSGNDMIVPLSGVTDMQYVTVAVSNVVAINGSGGSASVRVGFLTGDVDQNRIVTAADVSLINAQQSLSAVNATSFLYDINLSGQITPLDPNLANFNLNHALPAPTPPPAPTALKRFTPTSIFTGDPSALKITLNPKLLYVGNTSGLNVINADDNTILNTIAIGGPPTYAALNGDGTRAYVSTLAGGTVAIVDTFANTSTSVNVASPKGIAVNPVNNLVYIANNAFATLTVLDPSTLGLSTVAVGTNPSAVAVNSSFTRVYVTNAGSNTVSVLDSSTAVPSLLANVPVGANPNGIAVHPTGRWLYVTNFNDTTNNVTVIDAITNTPSASVTVGTGPLGISVDPTGNRVWVANSTANTVTVFDARPPHALITTITLPVSSSVPSGIAFNPSGTKAFVANKGTGTNGTVSVIDTTSYAISTIAVGGMPYVQSNSIVAPFSYQTLSAAIVDNYPGNLVNTSTPAVSTSCTGTATGTAGATLVSLANGTIPRDASCTLSVNVTSSVASPGYNNQANGITSSNAPAGTVRASATLQVTALVCTGFTAVPSSIVVGTPNALTLTLSGCSPTPTTYDWYLDNAPTPFATTAANALVANAPNTAGPHVYKVIARKGAAQSVPWTANVTATVNQAPVITSATPAQAHAVLGGGITFTVTASDPDGNPITVQLLDASGSTVLATGTLISANTYALSWTPTAAGSYSVKLKVTDNLSASTTQNLTISVITPPVSATPAADPVIPASYPTPGVGSIAGTFTVGESGAATYSIPIQVPPGTAGMQPSLSLAYNSQGGNGLLGMGWNLSGLSSITRCPKTEAQDLVRAGINYDPDITNDAFCLDGQRLIRVAGPFDASDATYDGTNPVVALRYEYRTELDSFTKIDSYEEKTTNALYGPYRFRAWMKSGQVMDYGSRFGINTAGWTQGPGHGSLSPRGNVGKVWVLDKVIDRAGNFMEIDYADRPYEVGSTDPAYGLNVIHLPINCGQAPGRLAASPTPIGALPNVEYWPTAIRYYAKGAAASECPPNSPNNQVRFIYDDVPSQVLLKNRDRYYDSGAGQSSISKRLIGIVTSVDGSGVTPGTTVTSYAMGYTTSQQTGRSLLQSVTQSSADGVPVPLLATQFEWAANNASSGWNATGHSFATSTFTLPFDLNHVSQGDPGVLVGDWDGDGRTDVLGWKSTGPDVNGQYTHDLIVCLARGTGFQCGANGIATYRDGSQPGFGDVPFELMDVNNDGRVDLARIDTGGKWTFCLSDGQFGCTQAPGIWQTKTPNGPTFRGDFDGDGRIDVVTYLGNMVFEVCLTGNTGFQCFTQNLSNVASGPYPAYPYTPCVVTGEPSDCEAFTDANVQYQVLVADTNGDGKADLIRRRSDSDTEDKWKVCFSDFGLGSTNSFRCHDRFIQGAKGRVDNSVLVDFNGDGIADLASTESGVSLWRVCLSTGDGAFEFKDPNIKWDSVQLRWVDGAGVPVDYYNASITPRCRSWNGTGASGNTKALYGDFNGDGRSDVVSYTSGSTWRVCLSTGSDFSCSNWNGPPLNKVNPDLNQWVVSGDFNGDGKTDILQFQGCDTQGCHNTLGLSAGPGTGDVLTKVTTGLLATTQITYAPLTDATVYHLDAGADASQRELDIQSPMYVVKQTQASNGIGGSFTNDYFYENLRGRTTGRGLYGFGKQRVRDGNGIITETESLRPVTTDFARDWPLFGRPSVIRKYAPPTVGYPADIADWAAFKNAASANALTLFAGNLRLISRNTNTWEVRNSTSCGPTGYAQCGGIPVVKTVNLSTAREEKWELATGGALPDTTTSTPFASVDAYGNPVNVTVTSGDNYVKATANVYVNEVGALWTLGRVVSAVATIAKPGVPSVQRKSTFVYFGMNDFGSGVNCAGAAYGYLCRETVEPDFLNDAATGYSLWQQTDYQYDSYGNRTRSTVSFKDRSGAILSRATTTLFGYNGRFPIQVTNALNKSEYRQFDTKWGAMNRLQGPNNVVTTSLYDGFGRKYGERVFDALNNKLSETWSPVEAAVAGNELYRTRTLTSGGGEAQTYFDQLQRPVRAVTKAFASGAYTQATTSYNALGQKWSVTKPAGSGTATTTVLYDTLNRPVTETMSGTSIVLTTGYVYGTFASLMVDGANVAGGSFTTVTQSGTGFVARNTTKYTNSQGQAVQIVDGENGSSSFVYDPYGNLSKVIGPTGMTERMSYDRRGRKVALLTPDAAATCTTIDSTGQLVTASWCYEYDGAGELVRQIDAKAQVTRLFYDALGRVIERREHPGSESTIPFVTVSTYDTFADGNVCANGIGKLCEVRTASVTRAAIGGLLSNPETRKFSNFDAAGRPIKGFTQIDGRSFESITTFDANGRVDKLVYPSGYMVVHRYTPWSGQLDQIAEWTGAAIGAVHWRADHRFADGQIQDGLVGNVTTAKTYDGFGRVSTVSSTAAGVPTIQSAVYTFDAIGNLTNRTDPSAGQSPQGFGYDRVNRVTSYGGISATYFADGNIDKLDVASGAAYSYVGASHRLSTGSGSTYGAYDANGNVGTVTSGGVTRTLSYNQFNLPTSIIAPSVSLSYVYDAAHARIREISSGAASSGLTYYLGGYEEHTRGGDNVLEQRHYLSTPEGTVGIYTIRSNGLNDARYWHKDHLGSVAVITDAAGNVKQKFSFNAWGNRTQPQPLAAGEPYAEERGYTGHEQLVEVGLVHMNGRIYDPATGRFLQADPLIQDPFNAQSYNRYSYVLNNPLSFTDPTGFSFWTKWRATIISIAIAVVLPELAPLLAESGMLGLVSITEDGFVTLNATGNVLAGAASGFASGGIQGGNIQSALTGAMIGGASAGLNFQIGEATGHTTSLMHPEKYAANVGLHAALGCAQQAAAGGSCRGGAMAGGFSALAAPFINGPAPLQFAAHVAIGAVASKLGGGSYENGAITAAFGYLFNQVAVNGSSQEIMQGPRKFAEAIWNYSSDTISAALPSPDATSLESGLYVFGASGTISKDGDILGSVGVGHPFPLNDKSFKSPSLSLTAQFIDDGRGMDRDTRLAILGGTQAGGTLCFGLCVGRYYSPVNGTTTIGTWVFGFGMPGVSLSVSQSVYSGYSYEIPGRR